MLEDDFFFSKVWSDTYLSSYVHYIIGGGGRMLVDLYLWHSLYIWNVFWMEKVSSTNIIQQSHKVTPANNWAAIAVTQPPVSTAIS